jgi:hypothetical protein
MIFLISLSTHQAPLPIFVPSLPSQFTPTAPHPPTCRPRHAPAPLQLRPGHAFAARGGPSRCASAARCGPFDAAERRGPSAAPRPLPAEVAFLHRGRARRPRTPPRAGIRLTSCSQLPVPVATAGPPRRPRGRACPPCVGGRAAAKLLHAQGSPTLRSCAGVVDGGADAWRGTEGDGAGRHGEAVERDEWVPVGVGRCAIGSC